MILYSIVYVTILLAASFIAAFLSATAWKRRHSENVVPFFVLVSCVSFWALFQALMFIENDILFKTVFANLRYVAIEITPVAFFSMAYAYKNKNRTLSLKKWLYLLTFPFICFVVLVTDDYHHLFYSYRKLVNGQLELGSGLFFWINYAYIQFFIIYGIILFIKAYLQSKSLYRRQTGMVALSAIIPNLANLTFNFNLFPFRNVDITPITFFISCILLFYLLFQYKLFDIVPIARDSLIENMDDMVIVIDNLRRILDLNANAMSIASSVGADTRDTGFIGMNINDVFGNWKEFTGIFISNPENSQENIRVTYTFEKTTRYFHVNRKSIFNKKGVKEGELIVLRDITALEEALNQAKTARDTAEQANIAKSYFLANMSHEIRTPMNAIIGMSDILYRNELDTNTQKEYLSMITNSAQSLLTIINDILDYSKIEAGKMTIENVRINFSELVKYTVEAFRVSNIKPDLAISYEIEKDVPRFLLGDSVRLRQLLTNLIGNSVKFTEKGQVHVKAYTINKGTGNTLLGISISDTGIGIPKDKIDSVFESFKQLDGSTTRKYGGTGLGLAIVKNILFLMKGTIKVESEPQKGSTFTLQIPFEVPDQSDPVEDKERSEQPVLDPREISGLHILVTEDNKVNQEIIKAYLRKTGCTFEFADNGSIALQKLEESNFDLILMDVQMPVMDGLEATVRIREKEKAKGTHMPIIALTAGAMASDIEKCMNAGMDIHLSKPIKAKSLYELLRDYIKISSGTQS